MGMMCASWRINWRSISTIIAATICWQVARGHAPPFQWVRQAGGSGRDYGSGLAMDAAGNSFVFAKFGNNQASVGSLSVSNAEYFLAKYDPDGAPLWVRPVGFPAYQENLPLNYRLACDAAGNVYVGGSFRAGPLIFGNVTLTNLSNVYFSLFVAKYDAAGNLAWATNASGHHPDTKIRGPAFAVAAEGNCYLAGNYLGAPDLGLLAPPADGSLGNDVLSVVGLVQSGNTAVDRATVLMHLSDVQMLAALEGVAHEITLSVTRFEEAERLLVELEKAVEGAHGAGHGEVELTREEIEKVRQMAAEGAASGVGS